MSVRADSKDKLRLWLRMLRTARAIEGDLREQLRVTYDTTLPRFDVMAALARHEGGLTMTALSRHLLVSNGNVTGIVERLVADDLVDRRVDAGDKRSARVSLTAKGKKEFAEMAAQHELWVGKILKRLDADEIETMLTLLAKAEPAHVKEPDAP